MKKATKYKLKKALCLALVTALAACVMTGCGSSSSSSDSKKSSSKKLQTVNFAISSSGYGGLLPVIAAYGNYDEEFGLDFKLQNVSTAADTLASVEAGKVDVGGYSAPAPLISIAKGDKNVELVGGLMGNYESLIVKKENEKDWSGELTADFLKGKKIATNRTNSGDIALRGYLADQGIDLSTIDYEELDSPATVVEAVQKGTADAGIVNGGFYKPAETAGLVNVRFIKDIIGDDFICCRLMTSSDNYKNNRDLLVKIQEALIRAYDVYQSDHDKAIELASKYIVQKPEDIKFISYEYGDLSISPDPNLKGIEKYYDGMKASGYIDKDSSADITDFVDTSIYKEALDNVQKKYPDNENYKALEKAYDENDK